MERLSKDVFVPKLIISRHGQLPVSNKTPLYGAVLLRLNT